LFVCRARIKEGQQKEGTGHRGTEEVQGTVGHLKYLEIIQIGAKKRHFGGDRHKGEKTEKTPKQRQRKIGWGDRVDRADVHTRAEGK